MKTKYVALLVASTLFAVSSLYAAEIDLGLYATFKAKLSMEDDKVYVDCNTLKIRAEDKLIPVKHIQAYEIQDPNFDKLKADAAKGQMETISGRFDRESGTGSSGTIYFLIENSKHKR